MNDFVEQLHKEFLEESIINKKYSILEKIISHKNIDINTSDNKGDTLLIKAAKNDDITSVKIITENKANTNKKDPYGRNPLYYAVKNNNITIVRKLLEKGSLFVDIKDDKNPLFLACEMGFYDCVKEIMDYDKFNKIKNYFIKYAEISCTSRKYNIFGLLYDNNYHKNDMLLLFNKLVHNNDIYSIESIIAMYSLKDIIKSKNNTCFNLTISAKNYEDAEKLIKFGFPINNEFNGKTVMINSINYNNLEIVKLLLENGISPLDEYNNITYLKHAINSKNDDIILLFLEYMNVDSEECKNLLLHSIAKRNFDIFNIIFSKMKNIMNNKDIYKYIVNNLDDDEVVELVKSCRKALFIQLFIKAANRCYVNTIDYMLNEKIKIVDFDLEKWYNKLMEYGIYKKDHDIIREKIENYLNINIDTRTLFDLCKIGDIDTMDKLLKSHDFNYDINVRNYTDKTLLMYAIENNNNDMVKYLIDNKINLESVDKDGRNALFYAICRKNNDAIVYLIENEAKLDCIDNQNTTLLMYSIECNNDTMSEYLISMEDNLYSFDVEGRNALMYACIYNNNKIFNLIKDKGVLFPSIEFRGCKYISYDTLLFMHVLDNIQDIIKININSFLKSKDNTVVKLMKAVYSK